MHVLFWLETFWPQIGGLETLSAKLIPALVQRGWTLTIVARQDSPDLPAKTTWKGIPLFRFPFWSALASRHPGQIARIRKEVIDLKKQFAPDLVHIHSLESGAFFHLETQKVVTAPSLQTIHVGLEGLSIAPDTLKGRLIRSATLINTCSQAIRREYAGAIPELADRIHVVPNGLEPPLLPSIKRPRHPPSFLCLGRLVKDKGFDIALRAFPLILQRHPNARLVLAGDGPEKEALMALAHDLKIADHIQFTGWISPDHVPEWINQASVVLVPSRWEEAFCLVALEAAFMARPVVASRAGGLPEVVEDSRSGLLVERNDPAALAESAVFLIDNPDIADNIGQFACQRARAHFSLQNCADAYDRLYRKTLEDSYRAMERSLESQSG